MKTSTFVALQYVEGAELASYKHGAKIGVVVAGSGDADTLKHVAMHVAASKPEFINPEDVPAEVVEKEKAIQIEIAMNEGKPAEIAEKMVTGRMKKFTGEISLTGQAFIMEPKRTVGDVLERKRRFCFFICSLRSRRRHREERRRFCC